MQNEGRLYSQVAAEAGVTTEKAMIACYLSNLSKEGKTLGEAAALIRSPRHAARDYARDWGISFSDYMTSPQPLTLTWTKPKRGRWELMLDGLLIAVADADGKGGYIAHRTNPAITVAGSDAEVAIKRLSVEIERLSVEIFGLDDVVIEIDQAGEVSRAAPKPAADPDKLRRALAA
jgi:hypothetical protein